MQFQARGSGTVMYRTGRVFYKKMRLWAKKLYACTSKFWHVNTFLSVCSFACCVLAWKDSYSVQWDSQCYDSSLINSHCEPNLLSAFHSLFSFLISITRCLSPSLRRGTVVLCLVSLCTLILFMDRRALQGGWFCFQFSPLPHPEKQHFQNQTNKTRKKWSTIIYLFNTPQCYSCTHDSSTWFWII